MATRNYGLVTSEAELEALIRRLTDSDEPFGFDIETGYLGEDKPKHSLHPETAIVAGISLTNSLNWARYVPLGHDDADNVDNYAAARLLWPLLQTGRGVAHNAAFELRHLAKWFRDFLTSDPDYGPQVTATAGYYPVRSCTLVESYNAAEFERFPLKPMIKSLFDHQMIELHELFPDLPKNRWKFIRFNVLDPRDPKVIEYACEDALWCLALHRKYHDQVKDSMPYRIDMALLDVVCEMEDEGVLYDWAFMHRAAERLRSFQDRFNAEIMRELSELCNETIAINLASPAKVGEVLFGKLGMSTTVYTAATRNLPHAERKMSTGKIALERLAKQHTVVERIRQWKEMTRLLGTYLTKYEGLYGYADDGRTHPSILTCAVVTGRFAVADPPLQQSPKKYHFDLAPARAAHRAHADAHGPKCTCDAFPPPEGTCFKLNFRDAIVAPPEHYILGFDLSQAELRAIAGEAGETALLAAFANGEDVHRLTASLMLRIPIEEVTDDQRSIGKTMNFALLYGMGVKSLADRLALPVDEAQALYDAYFRVYSKIAIWSAKQVQHGKRHGYVVSRFGRKLPIWEYQSDKEWIQAKGDRACVNYPIQGAATGDYVRLAMVRARKAIRAAGLADLVHLAMNVHDALEWYVHVSVPLEKVLTVLNDAVIFPVPGWPAMQADWHIAKRWGSPRAIVLEPDGSITSGGTVIIDAPAVEVDEDTGEETIVFDEADIEAVRTYAEQTRRGEGRHLIITVTDMPDLDAYTRFLAFVDQRPGPNTLTVATPTGDVTPAVHTDLSPADLGTVSLHLGPVTITYDARDVDHTSLIADLDL